ncbi:MAG: NAD(P)H-dependent oxidoreductase subunit E [Eubacteriales bacterium]|nr:NAD(P)H-dependent oxidoreductase subunit E [Eubacteriales bacterium]
MAFKQEQYDELMQVIQENRQTPGPIMPVLQRAQEIFGCVPEDVQKIIAKELHVPLADIYGVVTFYAQFTLKPRGQYTISVCMGTACYVKGSEAVLNRLSKELNVPINGTTADGKYTLLATRCLGACGLAPVMTIGHEVFGRLKADDIPKILAEHNAKHSA